MNAFAIRLSGSDSVREPEPPVPALPATDTHRQTHRHSHTDRHAQHTRVCGGTLPCPRLCAASPPLLPGSPHGFGRAGRGQALRLGRVQSVRAGLARLGLRLVRVGAGLFAGARQSQARAGCGRQDQCLARGPGAERGLPQNVRDRVRAAALAEGHGLQQVVEQLGGRGGVDAGAAGDEGVHLVHALDVPGGEALAGLQEPPPAPCAAGDREGRG